MRRWQKKTVIKQLLKYAPLKTEFARGVSADGTVNIFDAAGDEPTVVSTAEFEVSEATPEIDPETGEVKE